MPLSLSKFLPAGIRVMAISAGLAALAWGSALATTPSSGTLSPGTPLLTFIDGPFTGANPSNNIPGSNGPDCSLVPNTCSDYLLTISIPPGYSLLHPSDVVTIKVQWPDPSGNDFDLYVLDPGTGAVAQPGSTSSADPEITAFHFNDGSVTYRLRVAVFQAANESYAATITLGPPGAGAPGLAHSYTIGTDVWSCATHLNGDNPSGPPPTFDHGQDGEPLTAFDGNGRFYMSAITGVPAGSGVWYSDDACGQAYTFVGTPDAGAGGGDTEIRTAPEKNALGFYNVYTSSLSLANITTAASFDGGNTFTATPISSYAPVVDRNWNATYGPSICYLSFVNGATQPGNLLEVVRMDYSGLAAPVVSPASVVWDPARVDPNLPHQKGNIVTDRRPGANTTLLMAGPNGEGTVYTCWNEAGQRVYCSVSTDFGTTWTHHVVWDGGLGASYAHIFTWLAVDTEGNLYIVFSDDRNIYMATSTDHGTTWSHPVRVNRGGGASNSCIFAQIAAGTPGRVVISFYGTSATSPADPSAVWAVYVARSQNALLAAPDFEEVKVNDKDFHTGAVCENGFNCTTGRELCDNFDIDINPIDGSSGLAYGTFAVAGSFFARQVSGTSALAGKSITDRSTACPTPLNNCNVPALVGSPCVGPSYVTTVVDPPGTVDVPPVANAQEDILSVGVGEPAGVGNSLVFTLLMASLDPANLPPNVFWRVIWAGPGGQRYVDVVNCATGGLSSHYGHFTTGSVQDGPSDGFTVSATGRITITIAKSKVDNPAPGATLSAVNADCRTIAGACPTVGSAAFAPNDVTNSGQYLVVGNGFCTPLSVSCVPDFQASPGDHVVDLPITNPSTANRLVHVNVSDPNGWIVGGPISTNVGPIAAGGTGHASVTVRMPGDCAPTAADPVLFHVTAADLPGVNDCTTTAQCQQVTAADGAGLPRELALEIAGANPFRGATSLTYAIPHRADVRIDVYDASGRRVRTLVQGAREAGRYVTSLDVRERGQAALDAGVYFVSLSASGEKRTKTVIALR